MHIYHNTLYDLGDKEWDKSPIWPTKIAALTNENGPKEGERRVFICTLMKKWSAVSEKPVIACRPSLTSFCGNI